MTSVCLLIVLLFSEQAETMQCAAWKDEHEQTETKTAAVSVFNLKNKQTTKKQNRNRGFGMKKPENRTFQFPNRCITKLACN